MLKAVFFDAAGTLIAPREPVAESYARIAREYGVAANVADVSAAFRRVFHAAAGLAFGPGHAPEELRRRERTWWREVVAATFAGLGSFTDFDSYFNTLFAFFADTANWAADPAAAPALAGLKQRGLSLGIISNFDYRLYAILEGLGLRGYFDSVTISSEAGYAKPAAEVFRAALKRHQVAGGEAVHVGDSEHMDFTGAAAAGIGAILIDHGLRERISVKGRGARVASLAAVIEAAEKLA